MNDKIYIIKIIWRIQYNSSCANCLMIVTKFRSNIVDCKMFKELRKKKKVKK